jgi:hypothetical protein
LTEEMPTPKVIAVWCVVDPHLMDGAHAYSEVLRNRPSATVKSIDPVVIMDQAACGFF